MEYFGINTVWINEDCDSITLDDVAPQVKKEVECNQTIKSVKEQSNLDSHSSAPIKEENEKKCSSEDESLPEEMNCEVVITEGCSNERKDQTAAHEKSTTNKGDGVLCPICMKCIKTKKLLKRHITVHTGERPFVCSVCQSTFRQKECLKLHMMSHSDLKPFQCTHCFHYFKHKNSLKKHMNIHFNIRAFKCTLCSKDFIRNDDLKRHMNKHYGIRPHHCSDCGATYAVKSAYDKHLRKHPDLLKSKCTSCDIAFDSRCTLVQHMNLEHPYSLKLKSTF